jgi:hypothetical protein
MERPPGLVLDVDGEKKSVKLGGSFITRDGRIFSLGALYPDFGVQEIISEWRERAFLNISVTGTFVTLGGKTITLKGYETTPFAILTINRDPGIWLMIAGSSILVLGMVLLLFLRGEKRCGNLKLRLLRSEGTVLARNDIRGVSFETGGYHVPYR